MRYGHNTNTEHQHRTRIPHTTTDRHTTLHTPHTTHHTPHTTHHTYIYIYYMYAYTYTYAYQTRYELGSFKPGGDGFLPHVRVKSTSVVGMVEFVGLLFIRLVEASDLPSTDPFGKTDAFCEFQVRTCGAPPPLATPSSSFSCVSLSTHALVAPLPVRLACELW